MESKETSQGVVSRVGTNKQNSPSSAEENVEQIKGKLHEALRSELNGTHGEEQLSTLLEKYHDVFSLCKEDQGEMDLVELHIDTGDAAPHKYPV